MSRPPNDPGARTRAADAERPAPAPEDARWLARVRDEWAPAPLTPARRAAFEAGVQERLERARRRPGWAPALGAGLVAAALAALVLLRPDAMPPAETPAPVVASTGASGEAPAATRWAAALYAPDDEDDDDPTFGDDALPAEYAAIAGVLLDH